MILFKMLICRSVFIFISGTLGLTGVACSSDAISRDAPATQQMPTTKPELTPARLPQAVKSVSQPNFFELALDKAQSAFNISQSAQSAFDWNLVVDQWQEAIALLKAVPANSPHKAVAQKKLAEYQQNLSYARRQAIRPVENNPDHVVAVIPETPVNYNDSQLAVRTPLPQPDQLVYRAIIKRRVGGTPVIDVIFNGTQRFEMIVDTGASGTVITQQAAVALGVVPRSKARANTASARDVEFAIGDVDSIAVGGAVLKNPPVAIAPSPELETGLLGHDFFGNYDVTFKRHVVEFRPR